MSSLKATLRTGTLAAAVLLPAVPGASPAHAAPAPAPLPAHATTPHTAPRTPPLAAPRPAPAYVGADDATAALTLTPASPAPGSRVMVRLADCAERTALAVSSVFTADVRLTVSDGTLTGVSRVRSTVTAGTYDVRVACGDTGRIGTLTIGGTPRRTPRPTPPRPDPVRPDPVRPDPVRPDPVRPAPVRPDPLRQAPARPDSTRRESARPDPARQAPVRPEPVPPGSGRAAAASPVAPVEAGGGGTARLRAGEVRETGPGTGHVVTGLVLASVAAGAVVLGGARRRSRRTG